MSKAEKRQVKVDMTGVETYVRAAEGQHVAILKEATMSKTNDGNKMVKGMFEITKGECKGARVYDNFPLMDSALWKIKGLLDAIGMKSDGKIVLDLDKMEGKACIIEVEHEEYDGKTRARIGQYLSLKNAKSAPADDEDDDDEDDDEEEEEETRKPSKKSASKAKPSKKAKDEDDDEDDDDEDEDDEDEDDDEEDEKPKKKGKAKPAPKKGKKDTKKPAKKAKDDDDDDDDEDWEDEE